MNNSRVLITEKKDESPSESDRVVITLSPIIIFLKVKLY